jgi:hypothetical protein
VRITVDFEHDGDGRPLGYVEMELHSARERFHGWMELLRAIEQTTKTRVAPDTGVGQA